MSKTKIAVAVVTTILVAFPTVAYYGSRAALIERFPNIPPKDVKKVYRKMMLSALKGEFANIDTDDDAVLDGIFMTHINNL